MSTSNASCVFPGCPNGGRPRGNLYSGQPLCVSHYATCMKKAVRSRPSAEAVVDSRIAAARKKENALASGKPPRVVKDVEAVIARGAQMMGLPVQMNDMTGEVVDVRSRYFKPWIKVRFEDEREVEMEEATVKDGVLRHKRLLEKYNEASFLAQSAVRELTTADKLVSSAGLAAHVARFGPLKVKSVAFHVDKLIKVSEPTPNWNIFALGANTDSPRLFFSLRNYIVAARWGVPASSKRLLTRGKTKAQPKSNSANGGAKVGAPASSKRGLTRGKTKAQPKSNSAKGGAKVGVPASSKRGLTPGKAKAEPMSKSANSVNGGAKVGVPASSKRGLTRGKATPKAELKPKGNGKGKGKARTNAGVAAEGVGSAKPKTADKTKERACREKEGAGAEDVASSEDETIAESRKKARTA